MRKLFSLLAAVVFVACASSAVYAVGVGSSTVTARIAFTGAGSFDWDIAIKNIADHADATEISWNSSVTPGVTSWANAEQYVLINSTITSTTGKIRVYSDNKNGTAFQYTGTATENLGGLVGTANPASAPLSMSWTVRGSTDPANVPILNPDDEDAVTGYNSMYLLDKSNSDFGTATNIEYSTALNSASVFRARAEFKAGGVESGRVFDICRCSKVAVRLIKQVHAVTGYNSMYLLDKSNSDFGTATNIEYSTALNSAGFKFGPGPENRGGSGSGYSYLFMGANFSTAVTPNVYGCDTIIFQGINE